MTFVLACITTLRSGRSDLEALEGSKVVYFGKPNPSQESCDSFDLDICPDLLLAGIAAAGAIGFVALYIAITVNANGKRKKKRSAGAERPSALLALSQDIMYHGRWFECHIGFVADPLLML
jgi:hypothetical protein